MRWYWETTDPSRSGSSGDLSKLFRNENAKQPGVLSESAPSPAATVLAREVIQNSWDAGMEFAGDEGVPSFEISFSFQSEERDARKQLIEQLGLEELAQRRTDVGADGLGILPNNCLERLSESGTLDYLLIEESGTTGMYGPWTGAQSKMYLALATVSYHRKRTGTGGSYGYGKSGLIRGSAIRTIIAYTCFRDRTDDQGVTRRLLGMVYWGQHALNGDSYTGFARLGESGGGRSGVVPFENERADAVAAQLGIPLRNPSATEQLGTTFLVVEPTVRPRDLVTAIERSWWPALAGEGFNAVVKTSDGQELHPRPRKDDVLATFLDAYELATSPVDNPRPERKRVKLRPIGGFEQPGTLGLLADRSRWSYADQTGALSGNTVDHRSLVALIRKPRMVVEYLEVGRTPPYVRGVFVADDRVDDVLRATEPKGHDAWQTRASDSDDTDPSCTQFAYQLTDRIRRSVLQFRQQLKPPSRPRDEYSLPVFDRTMRRLLGGSDRGPNPPDPEERPFRIGLNYAPTQVDSAAIEVNGHAVFGLKVPTDIEHAEVVVSISYSFVEDDHRAGDTAELTVMAPIGFRPVAGDPGAFVGVLTPDVDARFDFKTSPYPGDWSGRLHANIEMAHRRRSES